MQTHISFSAKETKEFAKKLAKKFLKTGGVIALSGDLGSGKTTFTQGFAKGLGIKDKIISPTFVLIRQHKIPKNKRMLYHLDLYRLKDLNQINGLGISDMTADPKNILLIEWAEKAKDLLPKETIWIYFETQGEDRRKITVTDPL